MENPLLPPAMANNLAIAAGASPQAGAMLDHNLTTAESFRFIIEELIIEPILQLKRICDLLANQGLRASINARLQLL